jgi:hypothetical protein
VSKDSKDISQTGDTRRRKFSGEFENVISAITFVLIIVLLLYPLALADSGRTLITEKGVCFGGRGPHSMKFKVTYLLGDRCCKVI